MNWRDYSQAGLFGLTDGLNGMVGLVTGLTRVHTAATVIFVALLARAGASGVSMAGAQYQSEGPEVRARVRWGRVTAMGFGYSLSALVPGVGFAIGTRPGLIFFVPATLAVLIGITWFRSGKVGWWRAAATTLVIFTLAVSAGLLASLVGLQDSSDLA